MGIKWLSACSVFGRFAYSHTAPSGINEETRECIDLWKRALSAAPTPTQISVILGIILVAFRLGYFSYPFGLPCAVSKAFAPIPVSQH